MPALAGGVLGAAGGHMGRAVGYRVLCVRSCARFFIAYARELPRHGIRLGCGGKDRTCAALV